MIQVCSMPAYLREKDYYQNRQAANRNTTGIACTIDVQVISVHQGDDNDPCEHGAAEIQSQRRLL